MNFSDAIKRLLALVLKQHDLLNESYLILVRVRNQKPTIKNKVRAIVKELKQVHNLNIYSL